jgi:hypothetical protein
MALRTVAASSATSPCSVATWSNKRGDWKGAVCLDSKKKLSKAGQISSWVDVWPNTTTRKTLGWRGSEYEGLGSIHRATWKDKAASVFHWGTER